VIGGLSVVFSIATLIGFLCMIFMSFMVEKSIGQRAWSIGKERVQGSGGPAGGGSRALGKSLFD